MYRKTYIEIDVNKIQNNLKKLTTKYNNYDYYFAVIKGFSYGHGNKLAKYVVESGINYIAVSSLEEGLAIRKYVDTPILCLEPISIEYINLCIENNITITLSCMDYFNKLKNVNTNGLKIHLKVNSGMNRLGFRDKNELLEVYNYYKDNIEGLYSHFATSGIYDKDWDNQLERFKDITSLIDLKQIKIVHLGRSLTLLNHDKIDFCNGIRLGIIMYGFNQTPREGTGFINALRRIKRNYTLNKLKVSKTIKDYSEYEEAFSVCSEVIEIQDILPGDKVGYGGTYIASENEKIAVLPIGYADGYSRSYRNFYVSIKGKRYPIVGDICMGMIMVKVDDNVSVGDKVYLIGNGISVREASKHIKTTVYETMCMYNTNVPRVYVKDNMVIDIEE